MSKRIFTAAMVFAAVLLCACGDTQPEPTQTPAPPASSVPAPTPTAVPTPDLAQLEAKIDTMADAEVTEEGGALLITLNVVGDSEADACTAFFDQAEVIMVNFIRDTEYTGVSFMMSVNGAPVGMFYVMIRESGTVAMPPSVFDAAYTEALDSAFMASGFSYSEEW